MDSNGHTNGKRGAGRPEKEHPSARDIEIYYRRRVRMESTKSLAAEFGVNDSRIRQISLEVEPWMLAQMAMDVETLKKVQTEQLEWVAEEAAAAWRRSQENAVSTKETKPKQQSDLDTELESAEVETSGEIEVTTKGQAGDPRFLEQIRGAKADIRKIWGADAPTKTENTNFNVPFETRDQLYSRLVKLRQNLEPQEN